MPVKCVHETKRDFCNRMDTVWEASRDELIALKEIRLTGRLADPNLAVRFIEHAIVARSEDGDLELTSAGRRLLVRGSPALWALF